MIELMAHQKTAVSWLGARSGRGLIWAGTGVGKTFIALAYAETLSENAKVLLIVPASVKLQWQNEIRKFLNKEALVVSGKQPTRIEQWLREGVKYKIANYEAVLKDWKAVLMQEWDLVVCDEAHRLQNPRAKSVKVIKKIKTPRRIGMSATFVSNGKHDLFSPMDWVQPGCLGKSWYVFRQEYCVMLPNVTFPKIIGYRNMERFNQIISPWVHEIDKGVLTDLPALTETTIPFELTEKERKVYKEIKDELRIKLLDGSEINIPNALVAMTRLRQAVNTCKVFDLEIGSSKLETLKDLLADVLTDPNNKVLMFTSFAETAKIYYEELTKEWNGRLITGEVAMEQRQQFLGDFEKSEVRFLLGTEALGTGLNLQMANIIISIDWPLSWAKYDQRLGRAWRQGQRRTVTAYTLEGKRTIDENIHRLVLNKREQAQFTQQDIKELLD